MAELARQNRPTSDQARGIQNTRVRTAVDRQAERVEGRQLRSRLLRGDRSEQSNGGEDAQTNEDSRLVEKELQRDAQMAQAHAIANKLSPDMKKSGMTLSGNEVSQIAGSKKPISKPSFPITMIVLAVVKDIVDIGDFTGVGVIITVVTSFLISVILFFWFLGKVSDRKSKTKEIDRMWKKMVSSKLWQRLVIALGVEWIPWLKIIPATTILVFMTWKSESRATQLINRILHETKKAGLK